MNKAQLIEKVAKDCDMTKISVAQVFKSILGTITDTVAKGDKVTLIGFGTFSVTKRNARKGRNPQTGEPLQIPTKNLVKFKVGKKLSEAVK